MARGTAWTVRTKRTAPKVLCKNVKNNILRELMSRFALRFKWERHSSEHDVISGRPVIFAVQKMALKNIKLANMWMSLGNCRDLSRRKNLEILFPAV